MTSLQTTQAELKKEIELATEERTKINESYAVLTFQFEKLQNEFENQCKEKQLVDKGRIIV